MSPGALGAFVLVLIVVFVIGNLWFHLVEFLLKGIRRILLGGRDPQVWHPLPSDSEQQEGEAHDTKEC